MKETAPTTNSIETVFTSSSSVIECVSYNAMDKRLIISLLNGETRKIENVSDYEFRTEFAYGCKDEEILRWILEYGVSINY